MIRYVERHAIDRSKWDDCIARSFNGIIYAYSWYLDIVCAGWEALVEDDYKSVMPLCAGKKMGISYLYPPFFVQQLGVFSVSKFTPSDVKRFLEAVPSKYRYYEINLNTFNKTEDGNYQLLPNLTHELDLISSYEEMRAAYSENLRRNLKKAEKNNLTLTGEPSWEGIIALFRNNRGRDVSALREPQYDTLRNLLRVLDDRGRLHARGVMNAKNELIAGAFFIEANGKVIFIFSGAGAEAKETGAMPWMIDRFIEANAQRNLVLDFEGSNDPDLARFYKSFGSKECVYLQARSNRLPWFLRWLKS